MKVKVCMSVCKGVDEGLLSGPKKCKVEVFSCRYLKFMEVTVATLQSIRSEVISPDLGRKVKCEQLPYSVTLGTASRGIELSISIP